MDRHPPQRRPSYGTRLVLAALLCAPCPSHVVLAEATATTTPAGPATPAADSPTDAYTEFRHAFDAGQYASAVPSAQRVLQLAEQQAQEPTAEEVQVALMNLAFTQYLAGDYVAAETSFVRAIKLVQDSGRPLHQRLARAYAGLASTYHDGQRHDLAVANFDQAIALTRRHEGLLTEQQVPLLRKYVDSLTELGRYDAALQAQRYLLRIATRKHGENSVELVPTLEQLGNWYARVGGYEQARRTLREAVALVERAEGAKSPKLIGPLVAIAACNRRQLLDPTQQPAVMPDAQRATIFAEPGVPDPGSYAYSPTVLLAEGEKALMRAAAIAEERTDASPVEVADVRTQLGDWFQGRDQPERALPHYRLAWQAAAGATARIEGKPLVEALFGRPVLLQITRPEAWDRYAERPRQDIEVRTVSIDLTVDAQGRPQGGKVIDDSGDAKRAARTLDAIRTARYRPRFQQGEPVATPGVVYAQPWLVLVEPSEDEAPPAAAGPAAQQPGG
ncbi:MAG TPA: tetratricopeptide repeat protein [Steroidobacteraceae bacterium]